MKKNKLHIVPHDGEWAVRLSGSLEPASTHPTQQKAIEAAMDLAKDDELDVVVHRRDGSFRNLISFELIEQRQAQEETSRSHLHRQLLWGIFAAGALSALALYLVAHPPTAVRWR